MVPPHGRPTNSECHIEVYFEIVELQNRRSIGASNAALEGAMATWSSGEVRNASCRRSGS